MVRRSLSDKSVAEQDFFVSRAEDEIRKHIKLPPFTPATHVAKVRGSRPISSQVKGDVERELALVGISRMTYDWMAGPAEECTWNLAFVGVMARKSVEWIRLSNRMDAEHAAQAPAIIKRWLQGKCREIQKHKDGDAKEYDTQKKKSLAKSQYTRWRKKVCVIIYFLNLFKKMMLIITGTCGF